MERMRANWVGAGIHPRTVTVLRGSGVGSRGVRAAE